MTHEIKCEREYFSQTWLRKKPFEVRKDDRNFSVGDELMLREWIAHKQEYTHRVMFAKISYKLEGGQFGIGKDYCVLGLQRIKRFDYYTE
ncbi:protein of unknown function [Pseudarcicella hirudinis]|uniref:DUF3850 domain-containing protein n=1 Tax=Pseudarcicella hirudinis TaxID=1079859 RepID=A0A1I5MXU1_9BACT|nr:DUF3850 domain-containing protein [Pseudarcicella hirudinis]SFP14262.1 protein of unknown function [Pseudarcicella hirudinis]